MNFELTQIDLALTARGPLAPGEWLLGVLGRLGASARWSVRSAHVGLEDVEAQQRIPVEMGSSLPQEFLQALQTTAVCSCFLELHGGGQPWQLALLFNGAPDTTLTSPVYSADLTGDLLERLSELRDLCADVLASGDVQWIVFGPEDSAALSHDSVFLLLRESVWAKLPAQVRSSLEALTECTGQYRTIWSLRDEALVHQHGEAIDACLL